MTFSDPRSQCWVNSVTSLEAAQKIRNDPEVFRDEVLQQQYWMLMAEAYAFATLAGAGDYTGLGSGHLLAQRQQEKIEMHQRAEKFLADNKKAKKK